MRRLILRILAAALGAYLAVSLGRLSVDLTEQARRLSELRDSCQETTDAISALEDELSLTDEALRTLAWRQWGLVSPKDVVFFDGG